MKHSALGERRRAEVITIAERPKPDVFIQRMKKIRDHRLQIAEIELNTAKQKCETSRQAFRDSIAKVRQSQVEAAEYWTQTKEAFYSLAINAKEFVARKCRHQQLKLDVVTNRHRAREAAAVARADRNELRLTRQKLQAHRVRVEKLQIFKEISDSIAESALA